MPFNFSTGLDWQCLWPGGDRYLPEIDSTRAAAEWSLDDASLSMGTGLAGLASGILVTKLGYDISFAIAGTLGLLSVAFLLVLRKEISGVFNRRFHKNIREIFDIENKVKR